MTRSLFCWWFAACAMAGACGDGALPGGYQQLPDAGSSEQPRVSMVWQAPATFGMRPLTVGQDIEISPEDPSLFHLDVLEPAPAGALSILDEGRQTHASYLSLVAYRDLNHNGKLDFTPVDADHFVDEIVGLRGESSLSYTAEATPQFSRPDHRRLSDPYSMETATDLDNCNMLEAEPARFRLDYNLTLIAPDEWPECPSSFVPPAGASISCNTISYLATWTPPASSFVTNTCGPLLLACVGYYGTERPFPPEIPCPCDPQKYNCDTF